MGKVPIYFVIIIITTLAVSHAAPWRNHQVQSQVCGDKLADMLQLICSGRGYNFAFKPEDSKARRFRRGIVEECCHKSCSPAMLELYCQADPTDPPSNVQIRKRSDSGLESAEHQASDSTNTPATPGVDMKSLDNKINERDTGKTTSMKEGEQNFKVLNLQTSSTHRQKNILVKVTPNDTTEDDIPPLRHHKNHNHHNRRKTHSRKATAKTKRDKNFDGGNTNTFEIGTVKPYFLGRAFASYRSSHTDPVSLS